jgi:hypothetical protein
MVFGYHTSPNLFTSSKAIRKIALRVYNPATRRTTLGRITDYIHPANRLAVRLRDTPQISVNDKDLLNQVKVAAPCPVPWSSMSGDDRVRHCGQCKLNVYNLSAMPTKEAAEVIRSATRGRVCVQFYRRQDGTILTDNCPKGLKKIRDRCRAAWVATSIFLAGIGIGRCAVHNALGAPMQHIGGAVSVNPVQRYLSILDMVFLFLSIAWFDPRRWWKEYWPIASFSIPFLVGVLVDSFCHRSWPGIGWTFANQLLEVFATGLLFGLSCLMTAAFFDGSLPMISEPARNDAPDSRKAESYTLKSL